MLLTISSTRPYMHPLIKDFSQHNKQAHRNHSNNIIMKVVDIFLFNWLEQIYDEAFQLI